MELWDLYDGHRKPLGRVHQRGMAMEDGTYRIGVGVITINKEKQILLTRRDRQKADFPNYWEFSGGMVVAGETSRQGAVRELFEETGIVATEDELILLGEFKGNSTFSDTYLVLKDIAIADLVLQEKETVEAKWVSPDVMFQYLADGKIPSYLKPRIAAIHDKLLSYLI